MLVPLPLPPDRAGRLGAETIDAAGEVNFERPVVIGWAQHDGVGLGYRLVVWAQWLVVAEGGCLFRGPEQLARQRVECRTGERTVATQQTNRRSPQRQARREGTTTVERVHYPGMGLTRRRGAGLRSLLADIAVPGSKPR